MEGSALAGSPGAAAPQEPLGNGRQQSDSDSESESESEPFAEYLWMENEEDFDRQVQEELREQEFLDRCLQEMLREEEERDWFVPARDLPQAAAQRQQPPPAGTGHGADDILSKSNLNPDAKEFVPGVKY